MCEPDPGPESIIMANSLVNSAPLIAGMTDPEARRRLAQYVYRHCHRTYRKRDCSVTDVSSPLSPFGAVGWFKLQKRYEIILGKLFVDRRRNSNFARFTSLLDTAAYDEEGIQYKLPSNVYSEESSRW